MLTPIRKTITVVWDQERAFRRFTREIGAWWPLRSHVSFTWHPGDDRQRATQIDLTFEPVAQGTRLVLVHSRWEALGALGKMARRGYPIGWAYVLRLWADRRRSPIVLGLDVLQKLLRPLQRRKAERLEREARSAAEPG